MSDLPPAADQLAGLAGEVGAEQREASLLHLAVMLLTGGGLVAVSCSMADGRDGKPMSSRCDRDGRGGCAF